MLYIGFGLCGLIAFVDTLLSFRDDRRTNLKRLIILISIFYLFFGLIIGLQINVDNERVENRTFSVICIEDRYVYFVKKFDGTVEKKVINPTLSNLRESDCDDMYVIEYIVKPHLKIGEELTKLLFFDEKLVPACIKSIEYEIYVPKGSVFKQA